MFKQGDLVKSKDRTESAQLFVMVLFDRTPSKTQFNGVVIKDMTDCGESFETESGFISNSWNTDHFEKVSWEEIKPYLN